MSGSGRFFLLAAVWVGAVVVGVVRGEPAVPVVVEPEALPAMLDGPGEVGGLVILDCRSSGVYGKGHVAGARWVDVRGWKKASFEGAELGEREGWRARFAKVGVGPGSAAVVYDGGHMTDAARVWFLLQYFGVSRAGLVNGGYAELGPLIAEGKLKISKEGSGGAVSETAGEVSAGRCPVGFADRKAVKEAVEEKSAVIVDVRSEAEYSGAAKLGNSRGGHLPGAIHLAHTRLLRVGEGSSPKPTGRLKSREELRALFESVGIKRGQRVITHCQSGGRAALVALAMVYAGYGEVANYYRSFGDWAADEQAPVVTPKR